MIVESMTVQVLHAITLSLNTDEKWETVGFFGGTNSTKTLLIAFTVISLVTVAFVLFHVFAKRGHSRHESQDSNVGLPEEAKLCSLTGLLSDPFFPVES